MVRRGAECRMWPHLQTPSKDPPGHRRACRLQHSGTPSHPPYQTPVASPSFGGQIFGMPAGQAPSPPHHHCTWPWKLRGGDKRGFRRRWSPHLKPQPSTPLQGCPRAPPSQEKRQLRSPTPSPPGGGPGGLQGVTAFFDIPPKRSQNPPKGTALFSQLKKEGAGRAPAPPTVAVPMPVASLDMSDKLLHHQEGHDAAENPETNQHHVLVFRTWGKRRKKPELTSRLQLEQIPTQISLKTCF